MKPFAKKPVSSVRMAMCCLLLLLSNAWIFAGTLGSIIEPSSYEIAAYALYLQPSFGGNGLGYSSYSNYNGNDNNGIFQGSSGNPNTINNIRPKWDWGFQLEGVYHWASANDLSVQWYHVRDFTQGHLPAGSLFSGSVDGFYANFLQIASHWDAVNLELGHLRPFDETKSLRLHAGLAFANIQNEFTNYPLLEPGQSPIFVTTDTMRFRGFGPRVGGDFMFDIRPQFEIYAKTALSLLLGQTRQKIHGYYDIATATYGRLVYGIPNYAETKQLLIPELEAKLGLSYHCILLSGVTTFDIGYLWMNYLHAIASYTGVGIVGSSVGNKISANYDLNGLYFGLRWQK